VKAWKKEAEFIARYLPLHAGCPGVALSLREWDGPAVLPPLRAVAGGLEARGAQRHVPEDGSWIRLRFLRLGRTLPPCDLGAHARGSIGVRPTLGWTCTDRFTWGATPASLHRPARHPGPAEGHARRRHRAPRPARAIKCEQPRSRRARGDAASGGT